MTRAKQKLCLGSPLFQCSKRAKPSDFVCEDCSTRRIDAKRVRLSNYFIFAGEEGSYVCQNPRIIAHKFRFVTQYIHMIVFASGEDAVAATEKVNATRGAQYGLHPAHRLPIAKDVLENGFPCALNKHQHRLLPDASTFQDIDMEYLGGSIGDSPPHTLHRRGTMPFGPVGAAGGMPWGQLSPPDNAGAKSNAMSPRGGRSSSIIDISAPSGTLTSMMRRSSHHAGGSAVSRAPASSMPVGSMMPPRQGRTRDRSAHTDAGADTRRMSVARHFGEEFDENTLCSTAWNRLSKRSKLMSEQRMATSPRSAIRASSPPRSGESPTTGNSSKVTAAAFMSSHRPPAFMRSSSAAVTSGLNNVILPNSADGPRGVKRHRSSSSVGGNPYSPTAAPNGDGTDAGGAHVAGPGSSRSSSPQKRARLSYMFAAGGGSSRVAATPGTSDFVFDTNTSREGLNTPHADSPCAGSQTPPALISYQMHNLFSVGTSSRSSSPAVSGHSHMNSGTSGSLGTVASARDLFPTNAAGTGDASCALPPLDSTLCGPTLSSLNGKRGTGLDTQEVQSWLDKYQESQALRHHLDVMHQRQVVFLQQAQQNRHFAALGATNSGTPSALSLSTNGLGGGMSDPTAHLSL